MSAEAVIWHDLECGGYRADLVVWLELAAEQGGTVLDVGAGTGRVALALARAGHAVIALELDGALAAELERRAAGLPIDVLCADARRFALATPVALCIVPMQTVHLLDDRAAFLRCAAGALAPGGLLALALLGEGVEPFELELDPDAVLLDGVRYESAPTGLRRSAGTVTLERRRSRIAGEAQRSELNVIHLHECDAATLEREALDAGLVPRGRRIVAPTRDHAGSEIVLLGAPA